MNPVAVLFWLFVIGASGFAVASNLRWRREQRAWPRATARLVSPGLLRIKGRRMSVTFDGPAGPVTAVLSGPVTLTETDVGSRDDTVLVAYDPVDPRRVTLAADGSRGRGALLVWCFMFVGSLCVFLRTEVLR